MCKIAQAKEEAAAQLEEMTKQSENMGAEADGNTERNNSSAEPSARPSEEKTSSKPSSGGTASKPSGGGTTSKPSGGSSESKPEKEESSKPSNASLGQQIANKGCQYIGNPYVYGGNSLTNGIDCSGFVYQIHKKFGITVPRSSSSLRYGGKSVSYSDMLPGDVVCYSGHVGIYIGGNTIVHASNSAPYPKGGIKTTSPANYRTVLAVRRYW